MEGGESQEIFITVNSSSTGTFCDTLYIISDDPDEPELEIALIAECVFPPEISLSLYSINIALLPDEITTEVFTIYNTGGSNLNIDLEIAGNSSSGMAASFDGIDDYISIPDVVINSECFTIEMWARMQGQGGGSVPYSPLFEQRDDIPSENNYTIVLYSETNIGQARFYVRAYNSSGQALISESLPYYEWHHYAGVVSEENILFFIDGNLVDSAENLQGGNYTSSIDYIDIGRHRYSGVTHGLFNGYIDEVRIWNYPRSQEEIQNQQNITLSGNEQGLNAYWNFDNQNPWLDVTGNGFDGNPVGDMATIESTAPIINWLSISPESETVFPDSSVNLDVTFDATDLEIGTYNAQIIIYSNDPENPEIIIPIILNIVSVGSDDSFYPLITKLENNYPNPFNPETVIKYQISEDNKVELNIYNIKGQLVKILINYKQSAGEYKVIWN